MSVEMMQALESDDAVIKQDLTPDYIVSDSDPAPDAYAGQDGQDSVATEEQPPKASLKDI
jgi:hypothetical protein